MNRIVRISYYVAVTFILLCSSCEHAMPRGCYVTIRNNSEETIYVFYYDYDNGDKLTPQKVFFEFEEELRKINAKKSTGTYMPYSEEDAGTSKKYQVLVFRESTYKKYTKEELAEQNIYDGLLIMSYEELKAHNFIITYPAD